MPRGEPRNALSELDPEAVRRMILAREQAEPAGRQTRRYPSEAKRAPGKATWDVGPDLRVRVGNKADMWSVTASEMAAWLLRQALRLLDEGAITPVVETVASGRKLR